MGLERINQIRKEKKISIDQLVELSGVPKGTLSKITAGITKNPSIDTIQAIATALGCSLSDFDNDNLPRTNFYLEESEKKFINQYRDLSVHGKRTVESITEFLINYEKNFQHEKKENATNLQNVSSLAATIKKDKTTPKPKKDIQKVQLVERNDLCEKKLTNKSKEDTTEYIEEDFEDDEPTLYPITYFDDFPVSAGTGFYSMDIANSVIVELRTPPPKGANYMVRVSGDSMQPTIEDGDKIFIKNDKCINVGEIGIFILNSDFYIKELGEGCLLSHNPSYPPIPIHEEDSIECRGKFLGICEEDFK